ncbi:tail fiber domain-containing protein [bacterium]|nr:tail fiber domain-containing protein [bacterium]
MATEKDFKVKNGIQVGNGLINATNGDVSLRRGGSTTNRIRITSGNIINDTNTIISGNLEVSGNFNIAGDVNQTSVTTLDVTDKTITVANNSGSSTAADGAGIIIEGPTNNASLLWDHTNQYLEFNKDVFTPAGFIIGTTGTKVGRMYNSSGVMALEAYTTRQISFGNATNGEHVRIDATGNVGIGTTTPSYQLHVAGGGDLLVEDTGGGSAHIRLKSTASGTTTSHWKLKTNAANTFFIDNDTQSTSALTILANGNVGIGTTAPQEKLHVYTTGTSRVEAEGTTGFAAFKATNNSGSYGWYVDDSADKFHLYDFTDNADRITVDGSGNVGIGTASPNSLADLHVADTSDARIWLDATSGSTLELYAGSGTSIFNRSNSFLSFGVDNTEKMRINTGGKVGIGTTSPNLKLHVEENADAWVGEFKNVRSAGGYGLRVDMTAGAADTRFALGVYTPGNTGLFVKNNGNVGIGLTNQAHLLDILKTGSGDATINIKSTTGGDPTIIFNSAAANRSGLLKFQDNGTNVGRIEYVHNGDRIDLQAGSATSATMSVANGKVGIGTTAPRATLDVRGGHSSSVNEAISFGRTDDNYRYNSIYSYNTSAGNAYLSFRIHDGGSSVAQTETMVLKPGKVGIGTTAPSKQLTVSGADAEFLLSRTGSYADTITMGMPSGVPTIVGGTDLAFGGTGSWTEHMRIKADGNVGIGTSSPGDIRLKVHSNDSDDYIAIFKQTHSSNLGTVQIDTPSDSNARPSRLDFARGGVNKWKTGMIYGDTSNGWGLSDATGSGTALQQTRFLVKPDGKVGIGTTSPSTELMITGTAPMLRLQENSASSKRLDISISSSAVGIIGANQSASQLAFETTGSERMRITNLGNVGINTSNPYSGTGVTSMTVNAASYPVVSLQRADSNIFQILGYYNHTTFNASVGYMQFNTDDTERMRINENGNVGIGTTAPSSALHIQTNDGTTNAAVNSLMITNLSTGTTTTGFGGEIRFQAERNNGVNQNTGGIRSIAEVNSGTNISSGLAFDTSAVGVNSEKLRISYDGKIGGNTSSPQYPLDLRNPSDSNQVFRVYFPDSATTQIGTSRMASGATQGLFVEGQTGVRFGVSGTEYARLHSNGNFGIGTTAPAGPLHVDGHTSSLATILEGNGNGDTVPLHFRVKANNNNVTNHGIFGNAGSTGADNFIHIGPSSTSGLSVMSNGSVSTGTFSTTNMRASHYDWGSSHAIFGQDRYKIRELNNLFYGAKYRFGSYGSSSSNLSHSMFNGNFDSGLSLSANTTHVFEIDMGGTTFTYPAGAHYISFYHVYNQFASIKVEQYHSAGTYSGQWKEGGTATDFRGSAGSGGRVVEIAGFGNNYTQKYRLTIVTNSNSVIITDWAHFMTRPAGYEVQQFFKKDEEQNLTRNIIFQNNARTQVGSIVVGNSTAYNTTSDYRLKENVAPITSAAAKVQQLNPIKFNFIEDETNTLIDGFLAHEVASVVPQAVSGEKDAVTPDDLYEENDPLPEGASVGDVKAEGGEVVPQQLDYTKLIPVLTAALQEALDRIEVLENQ